MFKYLIMTLLTFVALSAQEYKAVFDCSSSDAHYIKTRMWLVGKTIDMIEKKGDNIEVVITLHGGCVPMISTLYHELINDKDIHKIKKAQNSITNLAKKKGVKVIACAMSLKANAIEKKEVLPFVTISDNSFIDTIHYQNMGYALMTFK